jgi:hypothetical protein
MPGGVTDEMRGHVQVYADLVLSFGGIVLAEQRVPIGHITGEDGATGTSDAVVLKMDEIVVADLKYGRGVRVDAEGNPQLIMYALGALEEFSGVYGEPKQVRMVIVQPRLDHISEVVMLTEDLRDWESRITAAAKRARWEPIRIAGDKQCRFCKAKAHCPELANYVQASVAAEFSAIDDATVARVEMLTPDALGLALSKVDLIEQWCRAVRARTESELINGTPVPGWKLVQGRRGARQWRDKDAALELLRRRFRLPVEKACELTVISPTAAERLVKAGDMGPRQWKVLQEHITQGEGRPSVAPESDKRPAIAVQATADEFTDVSLI